MKHDYLFFFPFQFQLEKRVAYLLKKRMSLVSFVIITDFLILGKLSGMHRGVCSPEFRRRELDMLSWKRKIV